MSKKAAVAAFVIAGLSLALASPSQAGHVSKTYSVRVESSFGTVFHDCFRFDTPASGDLSIDGLGQVLTYRHGALDTALNRFKAVTRDDAFEIMFFGKFHSNPDRMTGEAVSDAGDTFVFFGPHDEACTLAQTESGRSPYSR